MTNLARCPVCDSEQIRPAYEGRTTRDASDPQTWAVSRCGQCGHGFVNPRPSWDELSPYYSKNYAPYQRFHASPAADDDEAVRAARAAGEFRHIRIPEDLDVLDVGCGGGFFLRICRRLGARVFGVEPSEHGAAQARASGIDVFHGTVEDYVARGGAGRKFDVITLSHVLEHVPMPVETLRAVRQLLAPDGYVWIAVPNAMSLGARELGWRWHSTDLPLHLMQFTPESLVLAAQQAGLAVRRQYTYTLPSALRSTLRSLWRRRYFVPGRLTFRLLSDRRAAKMGRQWDERGEGEAIIVELILPEPTQGNAAG